MRDFSGLTISEFAGRVLETTGPEAARQIACKLMELTNPMTADGITTSCTSEQLVVTIKGQCS